MSNCFKSIFCNYLLLPTINTSFKYSKYVRIIQSSSNLSKKFKNLDKYSKEIKNEKYFLEREISGKYLLLISFNECVEILLNVINKNYYEINVNESNISQIVDIVTNYIDDNFYFLCHIVKEYIVNLNLFYNKLCTNEKINNTIIQMIENNLLQNLNDKTIEYLHKHNSDIFAKIQKLSTYRKKISQTSISKFTNLVNLNICNNQGITNLDHLAQTLKILDISGYYCGINQKSLNKLKYVETLNISHNDKIINLTNFEKTLLCVTVSDTNQEMQITFPKFKTYKITYDK